VHLLWKWLIIIFEQKTRRRVSSTRNCEWNATGLPDISLKHTKKEEKSSNGKKMYQIATKYTKKK
jgi:hypothetical protein